MEPERGARGGSDPGTRRGAGGGGGGRRRSRRGGKRRRNCARGPVPTRLRYRLLGPTACRVLHATSPPPPPRSPIGKLRPQVRGGVLEGNKKPRAQGHPTGEGAAASGARRLRGPRHHPRAQRPDLRPRGRTRPGGTGRAEPRGLGRKSNLGGAPGAPRLHS